jgi:hypothetical protein
MKKRRKYSRFGLIISLLLVIVSGDLFLQVDWELVLRKESVLKELRLPILFLSLGIYVFWSVINNKKIRERKGDQ